MVVKVVMGVGVGAGRIASASGRRRSFVGCSIALNDASFVMGESQNEDPRQIMLALCLQVQRASSKPSCT